MYDYFLGRPIRVLGGEKAIRRLVLDVSGVGYDLTMGDIVTQENVLSLAKEAGEKEAGDLKVYVHHHTTEQKITLYGFLSEHKRDVFRLLLRVSGVGPQSALNVLILHDARHILVMLRDKDKEGLAEVKGLGVKTAAKLILDLSGRAAKLLESAAFLPEEGSDNYAVSENTSPQLTIEGEVRAALQQLGYKDNEIHFVLERMRKDEVAEPLETVENALKKALSLLVAS